MAVTVNLYYSGQNGSAQEFVREMHTSGLVEAIRAEEGNLRYEYFLSLDHPETVLLIDAWTNQDAIDRHHASPMMGELAKLRDKYNLHMKVERFISDESMPERDQSFIRK